MIPQEEEQKKNELKKLFYSNLTSYEIQNYLNLTQNEYNHLLAEVKKDIGLPTNYRRVPSKISEYKDGKYYIAHKTDGTDFEIISYAPTEQYALDLLEYYDYDNKEDYFVDKATEEHMLDLIEEDYFNREQSWNTIMVKYNLSYHTFYRLLNIVKKERGVTGTRTGKSTRYIYPFANAWKIRKTVNGKQKDYGVYKELDTAIKIRDYLESINWDKDTWNNTKQDVMLEVLTE